MRLDEIDAKDKKEVKERRDEPPPVKIYKPKLSLNFLASEDVGLKINFDLNLPKLSVVRGLANLESREFRNETQSERFDSSPAKELYRNEKLCTDFLKDLDHTQSTETESPKIRLGKLCGTKRTAEQRD